LRASDYAPSTHDILATSSLPAYAVLTDSKSLYRKVLEELDEVKGELEGRFGEVKAAVGEFRGAELALVYYGPGSSLALSVLEELFRKGARAFVKLGFGALVPLEGPEAFVCVGAMKLDWLLAAPSCAPPAVPSFALTRELAGSLEARNVSYDEGIAISVGAALKSLDPDTKATILSLWKKFGAAVVDIDTAALLAAARFKRMKAASLIVPASSIGEHQAPCVWPEADLDERKGRLHEVLREAAAAAVEALHRLKERSSAEAQARLFSEERRRAPAG